MASNYFHFLLTAPAEPEGDFYAGVGFEIAGYAGMFEGGNWAGYEWVDCARERVNYTSAGISAPTEGGEYGFKLSHQFYNVPRFTIDFGKEVPAGTTLSFKAYGIVDGATNMQMRFESPDASICDAVDVALGEWVTVTLTLKKADTKNQLIIN